MDGIETLKRAKPSHSLIKLSILSALTWSFFEMNRGLISKQLTDYGYYKQRNVWEYGIRIFTALGFLCGPYLIKYHKSCKTLAAMGIWVSLPIFYFYTFLTSDANTETYAPLIIRKTPNMNNAHFDKAIQTSNMLTLFTALLSILYGFGRGLF